MFKNSLEEVIYYLKCNDCGEEGNEGFNNYEEAKTLSWIECPHCKSIDIQVEKE